MKIRILNPVYDSVFKILLENNFIAKGLVERITGLDIEKLTALPTERTKFLKEEAKAGVEEIKLPKKNALSIYRLDFVALIKNKSGGYEHLIIEMQKSALTPHLARFRQYLGDENRRKVEVEQKNGSFKEEFLPITTIYFIEKSFNKKLPPILFADKRYYDVLNKKEYTENVGKFVKCLTNKAYFIQTTNLPKHLKGDFEILNSFSNQFVLNKGDDLILEIPYKDIDNVKDPLYREMIKILQSLVGNEQLKRKMRDERIYEDYLEEMEKKVIESDIKLKQNKQELKQKDQAIEQNKQELKQKDQVILNSAKLLKQAGIPIEQIQKSTGLTKQEIQKIT